jgi:hypothetical protein
MKRIAKLAGALFIFTTLSSVMLLAQQAANTSPDIDPDAMNALTKMGAYLRTLKGFEVISNVTTEDVLDDGLKVQQGQTAKLLVRPPDRMRIELSGDKGAKFYLFDGKTFTLFSRDEGYYASFAAPETIRKLADVLSDKYGVDVPLADLFMWGQPDFTPPKITVAIDAGPSAVNDITCEQYVFRQEGLDWQVWIQLGDYPLPLKLVLTTTTDEARPQHTSILTWNLAPSYNEAAFIFEPPTGSHKITFAEDK